MISNAVKHALALLPEQVNDPIPYDIRMHHHLCELRYALEQIHFPDSMESMKIAKKGWHLKNCLRCNWDFLN